MTNKNLIEEKILLIDKPKGWTSFDVVAKLRNALRAKSLGQKIKVGHAGTLDPFATGLLIVLVGDATKKQDTFMKLDKEYIATLKLGEKSDTGDPEGIFKVISDKRPAIEEVESILKQFKGEIDQVPPIHSAIKINGQRAYKLARAGQEVELKPRKVSISDIQILNYNYPKLELRIGCSSGTYIRSLARDIGEELGTGAYLTELQRTQIGKFKLVDAKTVEEVILTLTK